MRPPRALRASRGATLIEAMISMSVLLIGLTGFASLQLVASRANQFAVSMQRASALATDLAESARLWSRTDPRLQPRLTIASLEDPAVQARFNMGRGKTAAFTAHYSDTPTDGNADNPDMLGASYTGVKSPDLDGDGKADFARYWNVYQVGGGDPATAPRLVQIIVRWKEPGTGYRQTSAIAFIPSKTMSFE